MLKTKRLFGLVSVVAVTGLLTACAGKPNKADGSYEYIDTKLAKEITIPAGLHKTEPARAYHIDKNPNLSGNLGEKVSIFPPRLIAPIVNASHIDDNDPRSTIWFEQSDQIDDLNQAIWNAVNGLLAKKNVDVLKFDEANQTLLSDWVVVSRETGWGLWKSEHDVERQKYRFTVNMKPHGRSGSLTVTLVEREAIAKNDPTYNLFANQAIETEMLNSVIGHFEYRLRLNAENRRTQYVKGITTELGTAANGDDAFILNVPYEHAWIRMIDALDHYELLLTDVNKIQGRIYARVKSDTSGFWSSFFGDDDLNIGLKKGDYVIEVIKGDNSTAIVFNDITLETLTKEQLEKVLPKLSKRLAEDLD